MLRDPKLAELLMAADEHPEGTPFDHYTKLQLLINKGKSPEGLRWIFCAVLLGSMF